MFKNKLLKPWHGIANDHYVRCDLVNNDIVASVARNGERWMWKCNPQNIWIYTDNYDNSPKETAFARSEQLAIEFGWVMMAEKLTAML